MSFKHEFSKPIHKDDLMPVLRSGIFMSLTGGLILGLVHFMFTYFFGFSIIWLLLLILSHLNATRIKQSYQTYHITYPLLSILFFILAYYVMNITMSFGIYIILNLLSSDVLLSILNPFQYFMFLLPITSYFFTVNNIVQIVFFVIGIVYAYRYSR